jgi:hypothetical protein
MEEAKIEVKDEGVKGAPLAVPQGSGFFFCFSCRGETDRDESAE